MTYNTSLVTVRFRAARIDPVNAHLVAQYELGALYHYVVLLYKIHDLSIFTSNNYNGLESDGRLFFEGITCLINKIR